METDESRLRRLALRPLVASFAGYSLPDWMAGLLADGLGGVTIYGYNIDTPAQLAALTAQLRAVHPGVIVAIDEEGGDVTRLAHSTGSPFPGNAALGAVDDPALTETIYHAIGEQLAAAGITLDFAPTVDVNTATDNPIIGTRSFGADPALVARHSAAAVRGLQSAGVAACAKHFPGHGATTRDSHHELPTVEVAPEELAARELPPFEAAIAAGSVSIMTGHIRIPCLTGDAPATFTSAVVGRLLRKEMGFAGVVATDALEMAGARDYAGGVPNAAVLALAAGADLLCIGADVDASLVEQTAAAIVAAIRDGRLTEHRVREAGDRCAPLGSAALVTRGPASDFTALGYGAARRAVRIDGEPPHLTGALVVQFQSSSTIAEGDVPWGLVPHVPGVLAVSAASTSAAAISSSAGDRPVIVVGRHLHRNAVARGIVEQLAARHDVVLVDMGWPAGWRPAGVRAVVTTYGASLANGWAAADALGLTGTPAAV
jgi:beta-N-acetylhexosaminidase